MNDDMYASTPDQFNDPYDSLFQYDIDKLSASLHNDAESFKYITEEILAEKQKTYPNFSIRNFTEVINNNFTTQTKNYVMQILWRLRRQLLIACFCKTNIKEIMWSHYADYGKGFAIEYDYEDINKLSINYLNTYKKSNITDYSDDMLALFGINSVDYKSNRLDGTDLALKKVKELLKEHNLYKNGTLSTQKFQIDKNEFDKFVLYKDKSWEYENEVRLILPNPNLLNTFKNLGKVRPKAVYIGEFATFNDEYTICCIAQHKQIPIYKMISSLDKKRFGLKKKLLTNKEVLTIINEFKKINPYD